MYIILGAGVLLYFRGHHKQNNRNNSSPNFLVGDGQPPDLCIIIPVRSIPIMSAVRPHGVSPVSPLSVEVPAASFLQV